jgi:hypothetical protein
MKQHAEELVARIRALQDELEEEYHRAQLEFALKRAELAEDFLRQQKRYKASLLGFLLSPRPLVVLTSPLIYLGWIPFLLMDLFITLYQAVCFPIYRIPRVRHADYLVFDHVDLPYLNIIEKFNCAYCSYGNGVAAYTREVAARTEQYWCPIKHARRLRDAHERYPQFFDYGDAAAFRLGLERLRQKYEAEETGAPAATEKVEPPRN